MKICLISNSGGHFEQLKQLKVLEKQYDTFFVTNKCPATENIDYIKYYIKTPHARSRIMTLIGYFFNFIEAAFILRKEKPHVIISTGAGICIPLCVLGKIKNKKIIFIETFARLESPSRTGKFMYNIADNFIIQHQNLLKYFPDAIYGGWIY